MHPKHNVRPTPHTQCIPACLHSTRPALHAVHTHSTRATPQTMYIFQFTLRTTYTPHSLHFSLNTQDDLHTTQSPLSSQHSTRPTPQTMYTFHCTLMTAYTPHSMQFPVNTQRQLTCQTMYVQHDKRLRYCTLSSRHSRQPTPQTPSTGLRHPFFFWRKVPESDARSAPTPHTQYSFQSTLRATSHSRRLLTTKSTLHGTRQSMHTTVHTRHNIGNNPNSEPTRG